MKKLLCSFLLLFFLLSVKGQLDSKHYLPPLKQQGGSSSIQQQRVYLSTPETTPFTVNVYRGTSTTPYATVNLSYTSPQQVNLPNGNNNITLVNNSRTGVIVTDAGLRFEAPGGEKYYVNYRGRSSAQAGSLTCKGQKALGTDFRWGGIPNWTNHGSAGTALGIMATEDNTTINIFGYNPNCAFRLQGDSNGITDNDLEITLNAGETYVLYAHKSGVTTAERTANIDGWLGATIRSDKKIAIANGGLNFGIRSNSNNRDVGIDQPVPTSVLGKEYIFVRGNGDGNDGSEFPVIVAYQNNTQVFAAGNLIGTINDGEYLTIDGSNYSSTSAGANMYVTTSKSAYAYQCLAAQANRIQTVGMNYIAPVNCLLPDNLIEIGDFNEIAGNTNVNSSLTIITSTLTNDSDVKVFIDDVEQPAIASTPVAGTTEWKTFFVSNLTGRVKVETTGPMAAGTFMTFGNNAGLAGYFSGFDTVPVVEVDITGGGCFPGSNLEEVTGGFQAYQWFRDGVEITGETNSILDPTNYGIGDYFVEVTEGSCTYQSATVTLYTCEVDVQLAKTADVVDIQPGDVVNFNVEVKNNWLGNVSNLVLTDLLPAEFTLLSATPNIGTWSDPDWTIGDLFSGQVYSINIEAQANTGIDGSVSTNFVTNTQDQVDQNFTLDDFWETIYINTDKDNDLVFDRADLDNDNDGILDNVECDINPLIEFNNGNYTALNYAVPSLFGLSQGNNQTAEIDISDTFGYAANSGVVVIEVINANVNANDEFFVTASSYTKIHSKGTLHPFIAIKHEDALNDNKLDGIISEDDIDYQNLTTVPFGWNAVNSGQNYYIMNESGANGNANMTWLSQAGFQNVLVHTNSDAAESVFSFALLAECDFDLDGIPNECDYDSDEDGCSDAVEGAGLVTKEQIVPVTAEENAGQVQVDGNGDQQTPDLVVDPNGVPEIVNGGQAIGETQNISVLSGCDCNASATLGTTIPTLVGISTLDRNTEAWLNDKPNAHLALESSDKGFVITQVDDQSAITDPQPGMIVWDNNDNCIKLYENDEWKCITKVCNQ